MFSDKVFYDSALMEDMGDRIGNELHTAPLSPECEEGMICDGQGRNRSYV